MLLLHVISSILGIRKPAGEAAALTLSIVNIALHAVAIYAMLMLRIPLEEVALVFMASAFVYTLCCSIASGVSGRAGGKSDDV